MTPMDEAEQWYRELQDTLEGKFGPASQQFGQTPVPQGYEYDIGQTPAPQFRPTPEETSPNRRGWLERVRDQATLENLEQSSREQFSKMSGAVGGQVTGLAAQGGEYLGISPLLRAAAGANRLAAERRFVGVEGPDPADPIGIEKAADWIDARNQWLREQQEESAPWVMPDLFSPGAIAATIPGRIAKAKKLLDETGYLWNKANLSVVNRRIRDATPWDETKLVAAIRNKKTGEITTAQRTGKRRELHDELLERKGVSPLDDTEYDRGFWENDTANFFNEPEADFLTNVDKTPKHTPAPPAPRTAEGVGGRALALPHAETSEYGSSFRTGKSVEFSFIRNTEQAPDMGGRFGQGVEPTGGRFMLAEPPDNILPPGWERGTVEFRSPLVIKDVLSEGDQLYGPTGWKQQLSDAYDGKTGDELSEAIAADGYDGIVTVMADGSTSEIVDLTGISSGRARPRTGEGVAPGVPDGTVVRRGNPAWYDPILKEHRPANAGSGTREIQAVKREDHAYRGMEQAEYDATVGVGSGVQSRGDYSMPGEGTSFTRNPDEAEDYVNAGRSDPRETGEKTYIVEVDAEIPKNPIVGYQLSSPDVVPQENVTRVWEMTVSGNDIVVREIDVIGRKAAPTPRTAEGVPPTGRLAVGDPRATPEGARRGGVFYHAGRERLDPRERLHVGTEAAAIDRITRPSERGTVRALHEIEVQPRNPYMPEGRLLDERIPIDRTRLFEFQNVPELRDQIRNQGYDSIPYINAEEGVGSLSYLILDTGIIRQTGRVQPGRVSHQGEWIASPPTAEGVPPKSAARRQWEERVGAPEPSFEGWPVRREGMDPRPTDTPPARTETGDYVLYHGTVESNVDSIRKSGISGDMGAGVTTTLEHAVVYGSMRKNIQKREGGLDSPSVVIKTVIDRDWLEQQSVIREIGGTGKNQWLVRNEKGRNTTIPPEAMKSVEVVRRGGENVVPPKR